MSDFGPGNPRETLSSFAKLGATSEPSVAGRSSRRRRCAASPANLFAKRVGPGAHGQAGAPAKGTAIAREQKTWTDRGRRADLCGARASRPSRHVPFGNAAQLVAASASGTGGSNARSAPAQGGASGTVASVPTSSFTMTTSAGQKFTVDEESSTKYEKGTTSTWRTVTEGESVLVLGTVNSTTVTATEVVVGYKPASTAGSTAKVVPFKKGEPTTSKQVGQSLPT